MSGSRGVNERRAAMSLVELLTAVVIIGIAAAGTMELAYVNAYWAANGLNKADNLHIARRFLDNFALDVRSGISVSTSSGNGTLVIYRAPLLDQANATFDANGFPETYSTIRYSVIANSSPMFPGEMIIQRQQDSAAPVTVLTSLVGPTDGSGNFKTFQYCQPNAEPMNTANPTVGTYVSSVIVNLELKKFDFGGATVAMNQTTTHSFEGLRMEFFLRNSTGGFQGIPQ